MKIHEFKTIVLGVHNGNVMLDLMTNRKYMDWEMKSKSRQKTILEKRLLSPSIRSRCCKFPEYNYRAVFGMKPTDPIVPGEIKYLCVKAPEKEN